MNNVPCVAYSDTRAFIAGFGVCLICVAPIIVFLWRALDSKIRALKKEKAWCASLELYISSQRTRLDDRASEIVVLTTAGLTAAIKAAQFDEQRAALRIRLVDLADRLQRVVEASWTLRRPNARRAGCLCEAFSDGSLAPTLLTGVSRLISRRGLTNPNVTFNVDQPKAGFILFRSELIRCVA